MALFNTILSLLFIKKKILKSEKSYSENKGSKEKGIFLLCLSPYDDPFNFISYNSFL